jgi:hypothetical protein
LKLQRDLEDAKARNRQGGAAAHGAPADMMKARLAVTKLMQSYPELTK